MHKTRPLFHSLLAFSLLFSFSALSQATSEPLDEEQPINITADSLEVQEQQGISIYKGNVIISQGSLNLEGDTVTIRHLNNQLQTVKTVGKPARFKRFSQVEQAWLKGQAHSIEYNTQNKTVLLIGKAQVEQPGKHLIKGPKIFYDINKQTLVAKGSEKTKGRVSVTFDPNTETKTPIQ